jgi:hypothetical protein
VQKLPVAGCDSLRRQKNDRDGDVVRGQIERGSGSCRGLAFRPNFNSLD